MANYVAAILCASEEKKVHVFKTWFWTEIERKVENKDVPPFFANSSHLMAEGTDGIIKVEAWDS